MRILNKAKDGGKDSPVDAYFLIEIKSLFSIALLKFNRGGRQNYHTHAFHALTWFLSGDIVEVDVNGISYQYRRGIIPKLTKRNKNHRVWARRDSWCLTLRGRWQENWTEYNADEDTTYILTTHRKLVGTHKGLHN